MTEGHLRGLGPEAALVYLFLCAVGNRVGISFWSRARIAQILHLLPEEIDSALARLIAADLIAANDRVVQVLPVPDGCRRHLGTHDDPGRDVEDRPASTAQARPLPELVMPQISDDEIRAHEAQARAQIARFYGSRKPSAGVVRALARSLALKERQ